MTFWGYTDNSKKELIHLYTFLYVIIMLTYRKIYFHSYTIGKKKTYCEKSNIFTCRVVLPEINLWFFYYQLYKARIAKIWLFTTLTIVGAHICQLQGPV